MKKIVKIVNHWVFIITTLAIAGVFYEGMALKWLYIHLFSILLIIIAIVMKILKIEYPTITLVLWCFYIWFLYGIRIVIQHIEKYYGSKQP